MQKIIAVLCLLALLLSACAPVTPPETSAPTTEPPTTQQPTTAPTTQPTTAPTTQPTTAPTTQPPTEPTTTPTEPTVDDNILTEEELEEFDYLLRAVQGTGGPNVPVNYYNRLLWSNFSDPAQVDLRQLFYAQDVDEKYPLTDEERVFLKEQGVPLQLDITRVSTRKMNAVLQQLLGLTLEETAGIGLEKLVYFPATDCYYSAHGDTNAVSKEILSGKWLDEETVEIVYIFYERETKVITLRKTEDGYRVLSNLPVPAEE